MPKSKLSPLHKKVLVQKQSKFTLDCTNFYRSKLPTYNSLKDRYLKYYVIRVSKKKVKNLSSASLNYGSRDQQRKSSMNKNEFDQFLKKKKETVLGESLHCEYNKMKLPNIDQEKDLEVVLKEQQGNKANRDISVLEQRKSQKKLVHGDSQKENCQEQVVKSTKDLKEQFSSKGMKSGLKFQKTLKSDIPSKKSIPNDPKLLNNIPNETVSKKNIKKENLSKKSITNHKSLASLKTIENSKGEQSRKSIKCKEDNPGQGQITGIAEDIPMIQDRQTQPKTEIQQGIQNYGQNHEEISKNGSQQSGNQEEQLCEGFQEEAISCQRSKKEILNDQNQEFFQEQLVEN